MLFATLSPLSLAAASAVRFCYFSDRRFLVLGLVLNYQIFETTELYLNLDNLTNESWENKASAAYGPGAFPQPGRSFMAGVSLRF